MSGHLPNSDGTSPSETREATILDVALVLAKRKLLTIGFPVAVGVLTAGVTLLMPNVYIGTTKILPPQQTQSTSAVIAQLGSLAGLAGGGSVAGLKSPNDLYVGMLRSRSVADALIARFDLATVYAKKFPSDVRRKLEQDTSIIAGRDGIIAIHVESTDPKRTADLANAYVEELFKLTKVLAVTEASQRRLFFEQQMEEAKENLLRAQIAAQRAMDRGGLVVVEGQSRALLEMTARLRAQITLKDIQIGAMRSYAAANNPELKRHEQELDVMRRELNRIENGEGKSPGNKTPINTGAIDNFGLLRDMKYYEATYELLAKQFEIAKIDEAKDSAVIQILDKAVEPDQKSKPRRGLIVVLAVLIAALAGIVFALLLEALERVRQDPEQSEVLDGFLTQLKKLR